MNKTLYRKWTLAFALCSGLAYGALAGEVLENGNFASNSKGDAPTKPWIVNKPEEGVTVLVEELDDAPEPKHWVHLQDKSTDQPAGIRYDFAPVSAGRLSLKLYFKSIGSAFGIYLGDKKVSNWETRIIDMKILKKGVMSVGDIGQREKVSFEFEEKKVYDLYIDFKPDSKKGGYEVEIGEIGGKKIHSYKTSIFRPLEGLRITTDSTDTETDVYVSDISLKD